MNHNSDEQLLELLRYNREIAFKALYDRYAGVLLRFAYRFCGSQEVAEEILHDVFTELLKGSYRQLPGGNLKSWLFTLTKNKTLNHQRKHSRESLSNELVAAASAADEIEEHSSATQLLAKLATFELTMPKDLLETWQLRRQGFNYQQIANQLAIPLGTVKSRFNRLVGYLREEFENESSK